jgi:hypothetical protein
MFPVPMARSTFENSMAVAPARSGGGWKAMFWIAVAMAGVGFAGYVFLVPYQRMQTELGTRSVALNDARATATETAAERDKVKAELAKFTDAEKEKAAGESKKKAAVDALITQLRPGLEGLGGSVAVEEGVLVVSFPADKVIDANGIDVSDGGIAALKMVAGSLKGANAKARILSRASSAPPPKELKSLFHSAGEQHAVRAARVMSALVDAGLAPTSLSIVGEVEKAAPHAKGKKPSAAPERLDIQVEPQ